MSDKKFAEFEKSYNDAVESIKRYQADEDVGVLVNWMLNSDENPYSYLDDSHAHLLSTAEGFSFLSSILHHALVDDGDVTFFSVDGQPQILFVHQCDLKDYKEFKRKSYKIIEVDGRPKLDYEWVDSDIVIFKDYHEWIDAIEIYATNDLKRCYLSDKECHGEEFATKHYSQYKRFNPEWKKLNRKGEPLDE